MNSEIVKKENNELVVLNDEDKKLICLAATSGDFASFNPEQKSKYLLMTCSAQGLNPALAANYYEFVTFQKKTVLYAKKGLAEALRDARNIKCEILSSRHDKEESLYSVKARASLPNGRSEEAVAYLSTQNDEKVWNNEKKAYISTGKKVELRGQDLGNLMMKCETKAKRRATLALCGLGLEEKPEGIDSLQVANLDDLVIDGALLSASPETKDPWEENPIVQEAEIVEEIQDDYISEAQVKRLFAIAKDKNLPAPRWQDTQLKDFLKDNYNIDSSKNILKKDYEDICDVISGPAFETEAPGQVKAFSDEIPE